MSENGKSQLLQGAIALALGIVVAASIGAWAFVHVKNREQTIVVTGSARRRIKSDMIIWRTGVTANATKLADAYQALSRDVARVKAYLIAKGVPEDQIIISSITTKTVRRAGKGASSDNGEGSAELAGDIAGYSLQQELEIRSPEVEKITKISREVTELMNQSLLLESFAPEYIYTKLGETPKRALNRSPPARATRSEACVLPRWACCRSRPSRQHAGLRPGCCR